MTDLSTTYMGIKLKSPLCASAAQPLSESIDNIKRLEDAGASAVTIYSLFEEQLTLERDELYHHLELEGFSEAQSFMPTPFQFELGAEGYLEHIRRAKAAVSIPVFGSLNGRTLGGWTDFAAQMQKAGADGIELNIYNIPADPDMTAKEIEQTYCEIIKAVKKAVSIPVAVKLSPFFTSMANMAKQVEDAGADGLIIFNRFYQPDIDLDTLSIKPNIALSTPAETRLPLRWVAILSAQRKLSLAATSGIHRAEDVLKFMMAGAKTTMMCSALLRYGFDHIKAVEQGLRDWMEAHEYTSIEQMQGSMNQKSVENPTDFERAQYMKGVTSYKPEAVGA